MNTPSIQRATNRWQSFFSTLSQADITVLDRAASGHKLKVVCYEQDVSYDTLQKRFKRWQFVLGLSSLATLLHVWRVVRMRQIETDVDEPTLMRYAHDVSTESARRVPEIDMPSELRHRHPAAMAVASAAERKQAMARTLAQCVLSPALWHALISVGQCMGEHALSRMHVPAQHVLFMHMLMPDTPVARDTRSVAALLDWLRDVDTTVYMVEAGLGAPLALPVVIAARKALALQRFNTSAAERTLAASSPSERSAFWECIAANTGTPACCPLADVAFLQTVLQDLDDGEHLNRALASVPTNALLGPLTGMSVAMLAMQGNQSSLSLRAYDLVGVMVRARLRHAEIVGVHPLRLLTFFSMQEAGLANDPTLVFLSTDERLIDEEESHLVSAGS